jgi:hypothetical protein
MTAMDLDELAIAVAKQMVEQKFHDAEVGLLQARCEASKKNDVLALERVFSLLVQVYCAMEPPELRKAEAVSREREKVRPCAYNELQTAMVLYYVAHDPLRAESKLLEAIEHGKAESDYSSVYTSLGLLGQSLLDLNKTSEAAGVLREIEQMILAKGRFVVGDETTFLEMARIRAVDVESVRRIATALVLLCRDPQFRRRLELLAVT